jgi:hypothetical protein
MNAPVRMPHLSISGEEDRPWRAQRLQRAYRAMDAIVAALWPREGQPRRDDNAVRWREAILSLHEAEDQLIVAWRDEDHCDKFHKVAELAWEAAGQEGAPVFHENADPDGLPLANEELVY